MDPRHSKKYPRPSKHHPRLYQVKRNRNDFDGVKSPRFTVSGNMVAKLFQHKQIQLTMKAVAVVSQSVHKHCIERSRIICWRQKMGVPKGPKENECFPCYIFWNRLRCTTFNAWTPPSTKRDLHNHAIAVITYLTTGNKMNWKRPSKRNHLALLSLPRPVSQAKQFVPCSRLRLQDFTTIN